MKQKKIFLTKAIWRCFIDIWQIIPQRDWKSDREILPPLCCRLSCICTNCYMGYTWEGRRNNKIFNGTLKLSKALQIYLKFVEIVVKSSPINLIREWQRFHICLEDLKRSKLTHWWNGCCWWTYRLGIRNNGGWDWQDKWCWLTVNCHQSYKLLQLFYLL